MHRAAGCWARSNECPADGSEQRAVVMTGHTVPEQGAHLSSIGTLSTQPLPSDYADEEHPARLMQLAADGSELAFAAIVARYRPALLRYAQRIAGPAHAE